MYKRELGEEQSYVCECSRITYTLKKYSSTFYQNTVPNWLRRKNGERLNQNIGSSSDTKCW